LDRTGCGAGGKWTRPWTENSVAQLTQRRGARGQGVTPEQFTPGPGVQGSPGCGAHRVRPPGHRDSSTVRATPSSSPSARQP
jgi:hypothetical protein